MTRRILLGVLLALILASQSFAANYYVSASSGSDSNPGTKTAPWQHVWKACEAVQAGDTAFLAGTFPPESHFNMYWTGDITLFPQRSGTADAWITYKQWPDSAKPVIQGRINTCSNSISGCGYHATIMNYQKNYIIYDGLETYWGYRGIWISSGHDIIVRNCVSYNSTGGVNNNTANIYLGPGAPYSVTIENNVCHDAMEANSSTPYTQGGFNTGGIYAEIEGWDEAGVTRETMNSAIHSHRVIVQNNTIYNQGGFGIRLKRMIDSCIVRNNTIYDCGEGILIVGSSGFDEYYYGNVLYGISDNAFCAVSRNDTKYIEAFNIWTFNNTVYNVKNSGIGVWNEPYWTSGKTFNNIFVNTGHAITSGQAASELTTADTFYFDYNCYFSASGWDFPDPTYSTLGAWQKNTQAYIYGKDAHSISDNPLFTEASSNNFTLQPRSPAKTHYKDTTITLWTGEVLSFTEMGAYGVKGGSSTLPRITLVRATDTTTNSVVIHWNTDVASTSRVEYGDTTAYGNLSSLTTSLVTDHSVLLSGLDSSTVYHFRVISADGDGATAYSGDYAFRTLDTIPPSPINEIFNPSSGASYGSLQNASPKFVLVNRTPAAVRQPDASALTEQR